MLFGRDNTQWLTQSHTAICKIGRRRYTLCFLLVFTVMTILLSLTTQVWWRSTFPLFSDRGTQDTAMSGSTTRRKQVAGEIFVPSQVTDAWEAFLKSSSQYASEIPAPPHGNESLNKRLHGVVPVECNPTVTVSETLRMKPLPFLKEFKNPCWREVIDTPLDQLYAGNKFAKVFVNYQKRLNRIVLNFKQSTPQEKQRLRCLPYFFLAGQPKCGTTDFYQRLIAHPDIVAPPAKESHWWGKNRYGLILNFTDTIPFSDYLDLYDGVAIDIESKASSNTTKENVIYPKITGDASVSTLWSNDDWWKNPENCGLTSPKYTNAHHVHAVIPQARIIVILRNPIDRLYSDFLYFQRTEKSPEDFHRAVEEGISLLSACFDDVGMRACIYNSSIAGKSRVRLRVGFYYEYLQEWLSLFPRKQIAVIRMEDYSARPLSTMRQVYRFLELRDLSDTEDEKILDRPKQNTRRKSDRKLGGMLNKTRTVLHSFYSPHNENLAKLLKDDRFLWPDLTHFL